MKDGETPKRTQLFIDVDIPGVQFWPYHVLKPNECSPTPSFSKKQETLGSRPPTPLCHSLTPGLLSEAALGLVQPGDSGALGSSWKLLVTCGIQIGSRQTPVPLAGSGNRPVDPAASASPYEHTHEFWLPPFAGAPDVVSTAPAVPADLWQRWMCTGSDLSKGERPGSDPELRDPPYENETSPTGDEIEKV